MIMHEHLADSQRVACDTDGTWDVACVWLCVCVDVWTCVDVWMCVRARACVRSRPAHNTLMHIMGRHGRRV